MQYIDTSDTFGEFLRKKSGEIGENPRTSFDSLILSIFRKRFFHSSDYNLSLGQEANIKKYSDAQDLFLSEKGLLIEKLTKDIIDISTNASTIYEISQILERYSIQLEKLTSSLVSMMPMDALEIRVFPDPEIYRESLFEENSWIEGEAQSMRIILSKWMQLHKEEVAREKEELSLLVQDSKLSAMIRLIQTTGSLLDESTAKVIHKI